MKYFFYNKFFSLLDFFKIKDFLINCLACLRNKSTYKCFFDPLKNDITKNILTKKQKHEIDIFYKKHYGKKVSYIWHNLFTMHSDKFDVKYIPFDIFLEFVDIMNTKLNYSRILEDKNFIYLCANFAEIKAPERFFYSINNIFFDSDNNIISKESFYQKMTNIGEVFIKPTKLNTSGNAKNCKIIKMENGVDIYSDLSIKDLIKKYYNTDFVVQKKIVCHKSISDIYSNSVNTFAISSLIWKNKINTPTYVLKIGRGNKIVDWEGLTSNSLVIGIKEDGTLYDFAFSPAEKKKYYSHPDTGFVFKDYKIELFPKVRESVIKLHSAIPWLMFCNWDITIDYAGNPVIIEMENPAGWGLIFQTALGKPYFGENTAEILSFIRRFQT